VARRGTEQPHQAGASLRVQYEDNKRQWAARQRRSVWLSALWWGPAAVLFGLLAGIGTKYALFGLLVTGLVIAAAIDIGFRHPQSLDRLKDRADAEAGTARELRLLQLRGGARSLHDRFYATTSGTSFEVEHLVVTPRGVFLVDSKQWHGFDVRLLGLDLFVNHVKQDEAMAAMRANAAELGKALTDAAAGNVEVGVVDVTSVLSVHADGITGTPRVVYGVIVVRPEQLPELLRSAYPRWSAATTEYLAAVAESLLPAR
jgi:Nuclease-related domain